MHNQELLLSQNNNKMYNCHSKKGLFRWVIQAQVRFCLVFLVVFVYKWSVVEAILYSWKCGIWKITKRQMLGSILVISDWYNWHSFILPGYRHLHSILHASMSLHWKHFTYMYKLEARLHCLPGSCTVWDQIAYVVFEKNFSFLIP